MLKLQPNPTFKCKVGIPVPGEEKRVDVTFTFRHMTRSEFEAFNPSGEQDADTLLRIVAGWGSDIDGEFSRETLAKLVDIYPGSAYAIAHAFATELHGNRLGN